MKITKFGHSCLFVQTSDGRATLFDPGVYSSLGSTTLERLDNIFITHEHGDHMDPSLIQSLVAQFPNVHITAPASAVSQLAVNDIKATSTAPEGAVLFESPHESTEPFFPTPQEYGIHYQDVLTHPGDSHSFTETKAILALPVQAPWGSSLNAARLALKLKPKFVIPIHDWHWNPEARSGAYSMMERAFKQQGITFIKTVDSEPFTIEP